MSELPNESELQKKLQALTELLESFCHAKNQYNVACGNKSARIFNAVNHRFDSTVPATLSLLKRMQSDLKNKPDDEVIRSKDLAYIVDDLESIRDRLISKEDYLKPQSVLEALDALVITLKDDPLYDKAAEFRNCLQDMAQRIHEFSSEFKAMRLAHLGSAAATRKGM